MGHMLDRNTDQADGLRRLFAGRARQRVVPIVFNAHVPAAGMLLERLTAAFSELGAHVLVVDAADTAPPPHELAMIDLASCIETLSPGMSYLSARGLPLKHVDSRGSCASLLRAIEDAATEADVILLHAGASDLARMLGQRDLRPFIITSDDSASLTDAYTSMKLLAQRTGLMVYDLLHAGTASTPQAVRHAQRVAARLAGCAESFLGAVLRESARVDGYAQHHPDLARLAIDQLLCDDVHSGAALPANRAAAQL